MAASLMVVSPGIVCPAFRDSQIFQQPDAPLWDAPQGRGRTWRPLSTVCCPLLMRQAAPAPQVRRWWPASAIWHLACVAARPARTHRRRCATATFPATGQPCPTRQLLGGGRPLLAPATHQGRYGAARRAGQPAARLAAVRSRGRLLAVHCRGGNNGGDVPVKFTIQRKLKYGELLKLVGNHPSLGNWKASRTCRSSALQCGAVAFWCAVTSAAG